MHRRSPRSHRRRSSRCRRLAPAPMSGAASVTPSGAPLVSTITGAVTRSRASESFTGALLPRATRSRAGSIETPNVDVPASDTVPGEKLGSSPVHAEPHARANDTAEPASNFHFHTMRSSNDPRRESRDSIRHTVRSGYHGLLVTGVRSASTSTSSPKMVPFGFLPVMKTVRMYVRSGRDHAAAVPPRQRSRRPPPDRPHVLGVR